MIVNSEDLKSAWTVASKATAREGTLSFCRVMAKDGVGHVFGTDMNIWCRSSFPCEGEIDALVNSKRFLAWLSTIDDQELSIKIDGTMVVAKSETSSFKTPTTSESFPVFRDSAGATASMSGMRTILNRVMLAADDDATYGGNRLGGLSVEIEDGVVYFSNTDGKACTVASVACKTTGCAAACKLPRQVVRALASLASEEQEVSIAVGENLTCFSWDGVIIQSRQLDGDARRVRYAAGSFVCDEPFISVLGGPLRLAVERAVAALEEESRGVTLLVSKGCLVASSRTSAGESSSEIPIAYEGKDLRRTIAAEYLLAICRFCKPADLLEFQFFPESPQMLIGFKTPDGISTIVAGFADD